MDKNFIKLGQELDGTSDGIGQQATDHAMPHEYAKYLAAVESGRRGGLKGGKARAKKLSPQQRSEIARKAAQARWAKT